MNPFDYVKAINETKEDLMVDEITEKAYAPFMVNRSLSYFMDTVFLANEMNSRPHLDKKTQFNFLINTVRPRKRFSGKWHKIENGETIELIMKYYGYSAEKARQVVPILKESDIKQIKKSLDPGGVKG